MELVQAEEGKASALQVLEFTKQALEKTRHLNTKLEKDYSALQKSSSLQSKQASTPTPIPTPTATPTATAANTDMEEVLRMKIKVRAECTFKKYYNDVLSRGTLLMTGKRM